MIEAIGRLHGVALKLSGGVDLRKHAALSFVDCTFLVRKGTRFRLPKKGTVLFFRCSFHCSKNHYEALKYYGTENYFNTKSKLP